MTATLRSINTTVTFLEMTADPHHQAGPPPVQPFALLRVEECPVGFYRYLYDGVGRDWYWVDLKKQSDAEIAARLAEDGRDVFVAYVKGAPAGYFELAPAPEGAIELAYFGLMPHATGMKLGKWLLMTAIEAAWVREPSRLLVETCTLDSPHALPLYQRLGFVPYARKAKTMDLLPGM